MIKAEIILGSESPYGQKLVTWKLTFPRIVLAEFNTHRMISKNSASSRAIPFETLVERVKKDPFIPIKWLKEHKGMQGFEEFTEPKDTVILNAMWFKGRDEAVETATMLNHRGLSKQFVNRGLEPYMWHTVIATGTEWENFFALRAHPMAEIHIQDLAYKMLDEYNKYEFKKLEPGEWHIPFSELINENAIISHLVNLGADNGVGQEEINLTKAEVSAAICAGISYGRVKPVDDIADLLDLHDSLVLRPYEGKRGIRTITDPIHASPTEHQARCMSEEEYFTHYRGNVTAYDPTIDRAYNHLIVADTLEEEAGYGWSGNLQGFIQYRKMLDNENAKDPRVKS